MPGKRHSLLEGKEKIMDETVTAKAEALLDDAKGLGHNAKQGFSDLYEANETSLEAATAFVQERPFTALAIVAFVGFVIGRLFSKKCG